MTIADTYTGTIDPARTHVALRATEPWFGAGILAPAVQEALGALGLEPVDIPFATRAAPMGPVGPAQVAAAFYNVNPEHVARSVPKVWEKASPAEILATQQAALLPSFEKALAHVDPAEVAELAGLAGTVGRAAAGFREGRPLFVGLTTLPWPDEDPLTIWHASKMIREYRGDGHVAALVVEGLSGLDALVVNAAWGPHPVDLIRGSRQWSVEAWDVAVVDLRRRGWITDDETPTLTPEGQERRDWIEHRTNVLAARMYEPIGPDGFERLIELGQKLAPVLVGAGMAPNRR